MFIVSYSIKVFKGEYYNNNKSKMVYNNESDSKEIAYDLRQRYATQIGDLRERLLQARNDRNYRDWFNLLDSLFIEISHKLDKNEQEYFDNESKVLNIVIKNNRSGYDGKGNASKIYIQLKKMNIWIMGKMEDKDIFGSKYIDDGL